MKVKDNNKIPKSLKNLTALQNATVDVGVLGDEEMKMIAAVHEYGVDIKVTDKMRGYLHTIGIHLKKTTTYIRIPERSFIRSGWDMNKKEVFRKVDRLLPQVVETDVDGGAFLRMIGLEVEGKLKDRLVELKSPPNSSVTVQQKGSSNPLVDTGNLLASITYRVK